MAVFVYSTGSVIKQAGTAASVLLQILNRTTNEEGFRVILWDTSQNPKAAITSSAGTIDANEDTLISYPSAVLTDFAATFGFEVEIRLSNPHMAPYMELSYTSQNVGLRAETLFAGELFFDSTQIENP